MRKSLSLLGFILLLGLLAGCAPGPNGQAHTPDAEGHVAGFWLGLWQGAIAPVTFVVSLFNPKVHLYEVHNNGGWYNLGFLLGLSTSFGGGATGHAVSRSRRQSDGVAP